ncbi:MAG: hypothetical protein O6766_06925 [Gammaproteobacteria bacterium]|nr:hypothetical protein [Gammaproteobacteria bacterium]
MHTQSIVEQSPQARICMQQILQPWLRFYRLRQISRSRIARGR